MENYFSIRTDVQIDVTDLPEWRSINEQNLFSPGKYKKKSMDNILQNKLQITYYNNGLTIQTQHFKSKQHKSQITKQNKTKPEIAIDF